MEITGNSRFNKGSSISTLSSKGKQKQGTSPSRSQRTTTTVRDRPAEDQQGKTVKRKRVTFQLPEDENNNVVCTPPTTTKLSSSIKYNYKTVMASAELASARPVNITPARAHVNNKWGSSSKNWTLWSTWDSELLDFPVDDFLISKADLLTKINFTAKQNFLEDIGWQPLSDTMFLVVRIVQEDIEKCYFPFAQEIQLDAEQMILMEDNGGKSAVQLEPINVLACGELAQILQATVNHGDIFIISGGYDFLRYRKNTPAPLVGLNFNKESQTRILRVVDIPKNVYGRVILFEKIEPLLEKSRFKFSYMARHGSSRRSIEQHRSFAYDQFCRDVKDTLAYSRNRWDFPVPISRGAHNVVSLYQLLSSQNYRMPTTSGGDSFTAPKDQTNGSSEDDDNCGYHTPSANPPRRRQERLHLPIRNAVFNRGRTNKNTVALTQDQDTIIWKSKKPSEHFHIYRRLLRSCVFLTVIIVITVVGFAVSSIKYFNSNSNVDSCPASFWSNKLSAVNLNSDGTQEPIHLTSKQVIVLETIDRDPEKLESKLFPIQIRAIKHHYINAYKNISGWIVSKTGTMMQWLDITVGWIKYNCNLQRVLSKLGLDVDFVLDIL